MMCNRKRQKCFSAWLLPWDALCPVSAHHRHTCNRRQHGWEKIATTAGTLSTTNGMFVFLLIVVVLLIGALSFFPALALGPLAEFFGSIA